MMHATYTGPLAHLQGKSALVRPSPMDAGHVLVQFLETETFADPEYVKAHPEMRMSQSLGFGWHRFPEEHFTAGVSP
jgi:hypothetical protein